MTPPTRVEAGKIWLGRYDDPEERGYYQADNLTFAQLAQFIRKLTIGDATKDSDDYISSFVQGNFTGGGQVEEMNEAAEIDRFYTAIADTMSANRNALPPYVWRARPNSNCTECRALDVGNDGIMYYAFNESGTWKVWGLNQTTRLFDYNSGTGVALGSAPVGKAVRFDGAIYVPRGSSGYTHITGSAGTPTCTTVSGSADPTTASPTSAPRPLMFRVFTQRLYAITAEGGIAYHTIAQKDAGANAWHWPYGETTTDFPHIESSNTPLAMQVFPDKAGVESLYVKTENGLLIFDDNNPMFLETHVEFPPHPDKNQAFAVWPPGGDLHAPIGLYDTKLSTAFVYDPKFGLARDHGLPNELRGSITDIEPTIDMLYALVGGVLEVAISIGYQAKWGSAGSGNTNFNNPGQVAIDASGNIYIADNGNSRVKKHQADGTYTSSITSGLGATTGVAVDSSGNIYVVDSGNTRIKKFNSAFTQQWSVVNVGNTSGETYAGHIATDGTYVYASVINTLNSQHYIVRTLASTGSSVGIGVSVIGSSGTGDGQFNTPVGVATDGTYLYVVDQGNDRVQKFTTAGVFVTTWGSSGVGDGQFQTPVGIAINPVNGNVLVTDSGRDDVQEFTNTGVFVRKFASNGSGDGQVDTPTGIVVTTDGASVYVADQGNDRIQQFDYDTASSQLTAYPSLHVWTSLGWHGLWKGSDSGATPNWLKAHAATLGYNITWGMDDGYAYVMRQRRTFHNARVGFLAGVDEFAESGYIETGYFDAAMEGFDKIASALVFLDVMASSTETITVEYKIDGGGWQPLGVISETADKVILPFEMSGTFSKGRRFNKIAFRYSMVRGSTLTATPVIDSATLLFTKIPQNTTSYQFSLPLWDAEGRTAHEQYNDLTALVTAGEFLAFVVGRESHDSDENDIPSLHRVLIASVSGAGDTGEKGNMRAELSIISIPDGVSTVAA